MLYSIGKWMGSVGVGSLLSDAGEGEVTEVIALDSKSTLRLCPFCTYLLASSMCDLCEFHVTRVVV